MPYALIPIGLSAILIYGFTLLLSRAGLLKPANHKKFWNTALLLTFFTTAILGIILAIQVNYKLEMPIIDRLIVWHVDFGIGMSFIAIFHFSWHWSYYRKLITRSGPPQSGPAQPGNIKSDDEMLPGQHFSAGVAVSYRSIPFGEKIPLLVLGATAMITQVIFLREYLALFHGNELVIGLILAGWLLLTGTGALVGSNIPGSGLKPGFTPVAFFILGIIPLVSVTGIRFFRNIVFPAGSISGIPGILLYSIAGMAVFCILSGFMFTWLSSDLSKKHGANLLNFSYALEATGSIGAGILFSFLLVLIMNTYQILFLLLILNLATAAIIREKGKRLTIIGWSLPMALILAFLVFPMKLDHLTRSFLFPNQELLETRDSPYGNLVITRTGAQYTLFENSSPTAVTEDIASVEEDVHYALVQHPEPENILVLSGNLGGLVSELEKYPVRHVDYVELNPWTKKIRDKYMPLPDVSWLTEINMDGRRFLAGTDRKYDVVLVNLPAPGSARVNRFYTAEFFAEVKLHLEPGGILSIPMHGTENYLNTEGANLFSILYHTMKLQFKNVLLIPGIKTFFIASDEKLDIDIPALIESRGLQTEYVNGFYLDRYTLMERNRQLMEALPETTEINRDFRPVAFLHQISYWLSYFSSNLWISIVLLLGLILLIGLRAGKLGTGIFITGFTGMGTEIVLLMAIQIVFGYVYLYAAIMLTVFMMGLASGAILVRKIIPVISRRYFALLQVLLAVTVFLIFWWIMLIEGKTIPGVLLHTAFLVLTFLASLISGLLFALAALLGKSGIPRTAGGLYSADLAGSAAGALIMAIGMIPLLGLYGSLAVLIVLNLLASLYTVTGRYGPGFNPARNS